MDKRTIGFCVDCVHCQKGRSGVRLCSQKDIRDVVAGEKMYPACSDERRRVPVSVFGLDSRNRCGPYGLNFENKE